MEIAFEGPNGPEDWIGIVPKDGTVDDYQGRWKGTADGSPVTLQAPSEAGTYDVIYVTGIDQTILTRQPLTVGEKCDVQLRTSEHRSMYSYVRLMYSYVRLSIDRCTATYV